MIRDAKDQPILNAGIVSDEDIILIGDKDFYAKAASYPNHGQIMPLGSGKNNLDRSGHFTSGHKIWFFLTEPSSVTYNAFGKFCVDFS